MHTGYGRQYSSLISAGQVLITGVLWPLISMSPFPFEDVLPLWSSDSLQRLLSFLSLLSFMLYPASLALKEN